MYGHVDLMEPAPSAQSGSTLGLADNLEYIGTKGQNTHTSHVHLLVSFLLKSPAHYSIYSGSLNWLSEQLCPQNSVNCVG